MNKSISSFAQICLATVLGIALAGCATSSTQPASSAPAAAPAATAAPADATPTASSAPAAAAPAAMATPAGGIIRIKAGSAAPFTDTEGNVWQADQGFDGGDTTERDASTQIADTKDPGLFLSEHYGMDSFSIKVPNGNYTAKLYFAETYEGITGAGQRVFSFNVNGQKSFTNFDIYAQVGADKALVETVPVTVSNGEFKIDFTSITENPEINGVELDPQ